MDNEKRFVTSVYNIQILKDFRILEQIKGQKINGDLKSRNESGTKKNPGSIQLPGFHKLCHKF
jgi:hypothetical protein